MMYARILDRVRAVRGVEAVGASRVPVLSGNARSVTISSDGQPLDRARRNSLPVRTNTITEGYLPTMSIPLLVGRNFTVADDGGAMPVAIVSRSLAKQLWPRGDPIGRSLVTGAGSLTVVGMVADAVYASAVERRPPPFFYVPLKRAMNRVSRCTCGLPATTGARAGVRQAVRELDPQLVVAQPGRSRRRLSRRSTSNG